MDKEMASAVVAPCDDGLRVATVYHELREMWQVLIDDFVMTPYSPAGSASEATAVSALPPAAGCIPLWRPDLLAGKCGTEDASFATLLPVALLSFGQ